VKNFETCVKKQWQIFKWKGSILEKGLSPVPIFASIYFTIEKNKTHNPWVGFGFSILIMCFCISGFEDKFWCKKSLSAKLTSFDVLVGWNLEF
jgi:hypothetical protein